MVTTYEPRTVTTSTAPAHTRPRWFLLVAAVLAVVLAGLGGYALAGGFSTSEGQRVADSVIQVWRTGNVEDMNAIYAPTVEFGLDGDTSTISREQLRANIQVSLTNSGQTGEDAISQVGPVAELADGDGDLYVTTMVEMGGVSYSGFYRVHDGMVVSHVFLTVRSYEPAK